MEKKSTINAYRFIKPLVNIHIDDTSAYLLLTFLCQVANNMTGASWHGYASITYTTGLSQKTIQRATKTLVQLGVISCTLRGKEETKLYTVHHHKLLELAEQGKAGRDKFILGQKEQGAARKRKQRCRSQQEALVPVTMTGHTDAPVPVKSALCPGQIDGFVPVTRAGCPGHHDQGTTKELLKGTNKELDAGASKNSGSISEIEAKLAKLQILKKQAISGENFTQQCPSLAAYNALIHQIQECEREYSIARGRVGVLFQQAQEASKKALTSPGANL